MQELIIEESHIDLMQAFADKQADGWHTVLGSIGCGSVVRYGMIPQRPHPDVYPLGMPWEPPTEAPKFGKDYFWMVVEKSDIKIEASLTMTIDEQSETGFPEVVDGNRKDGDWVP